MVWYRCPGIFLALPWMDIRNLFPTNTAFVCCCKGMRDCIICYKAGKVRTVVQILD